MIKKNIDVPNLVFCFVKLETTGVIWYMNVTRPNKGTFVQACRVYLVVFFSKTSIVRLSPENWRCASTENFSKNVGARLSESKSDVIGEEKY